MLQSNKSYNGPLIRLNPNDNVLIAREPLTIGHQVSIDGAAIRLRAQVAAGHKVAARRIASGEPIRKYDTVIGVAARDIEPGDHVHTHNITLVDFARDPGFGLDVKPVDYVAPEQRATFDGIVRPDGRVATRNFVGIIASV
ncbi:MAG TPA: SAF domain-containing protein, partial [Paraburkholderia sp.]|uniref:UxaA family hydrolase n=1 Tax=Paraburkholderia sp. TaxID=1926495 RepID=UPI002B497290